MSVVQVGRDRSHPEAGVVLFRDRGQRIGIACELRFSVEGLVGRAGAACARAIVESPEGLRRKIGMLTGGELPLVNVVKRRRNNRETSGVDQRSLERSRSNFSGANVGIFRRRRSQRRNPLCDRHDRQSLDKRPRRRAGCLVAGYAVLIGSWTGILPRTRRVICLYLLPGPGAQTTFRYEHTARGKQSHLEELAPTGESGGDQFAPVLRGVDHLAIARL